MQLVYRYGLAAPAEERGGGGGGRPAREALARGGGPGARRLPHDP